MANRFQAARHRDGTGHRPGPGAGPGGAPGSGSWTSCRGRWLAEGAFRTGKDRMHHYRISAGSAAEAESGLDLALGWPSLEASLRTGTDSPLRRVSSTDRLEPSRRSASAGIRSPSAITRLSPGTTSRSAMRRCVPSWMTSARGLDKSWRASGACSVRRSWTMVRPMTTRRNPRSNGGSSGTSMMRYSEPSAARSRNMGSRTTLRAMARRLRSSREGSSLGHSRIKRPAVPGEVRPVSPAKARPAGVFVPRQSCRPLHSPKRRTNQVFTSWVRPA
jgi:hypothetical protein